MVPNDLTSWYVHPVQSSPPECGGDQMTHSSWTEKGDGMPLPWLHYRNKRLTCHRTKVGYWPRDNTKNWDLQPNNQEGTKCCQQPWACNGGRSQPPVSSDKTKVPSDMLNTVLWETLSQGTQESYAQILDQQKIPCFKSLSFRVICHIALRVELYPPQNLYVEVLTPSSSERELMWRWNVYRSHQVNVRSSG